jgi:LysR family glycine cleavage system transcriptional activator
MPNLVHLKSLRALELAVRRGSLKAAADELAVTPAAVGQRIKALEDYLGCELLVRGRTGIRPTRGLEVAMAHLSAAFRELETAVGILGMHLVQEIHIVADSDRAELLLWPRLHQFKSIHPNTLFCVNGVGGVPLRMGSGPRWRGFAIGSSARATRPRPSFAV